MHTAPILTCARCQEDANYQKVLSTPSHLEALSAGNPGPSPLPADTGSPWLLSETSLWLANQQQSY